MPRVRIPLNNFAFGEVNPSLSSRTDNAIYAQSGEIVENFYIRPEGGLKKRAGTWLHDSIPHDGVSASTSNMDVRLEPFIFSDDEKYIIAFDSGGFTPYKVEPNTTDAIDNTFGDSLGITQLERITSSDKYRTVTGNFHITDETAHNANVANGIATDGIVSGENQLARNKYILRDEAPHDNFTMGIRRNGIMIRPLPETGTSGNRFYPINHVFFNDETYTGTTTTTGIGGTGLNVTVTAIKSGVNAANTKYNFTFTNSDPFCLQPEIDGSIRYINTNQSFELLNQSSNNWSVTFKEDAVKEIYTTNTNTGIVINISTSGTHSLLTNTTKYNGDAVPNNDYDLRHLSFDPYGFIDYTDSSDTNNTDVISCPWTSSTLNQFTYTQRGDFMIICHDTWQPVMIVRTALNQFEIRQFTFDKSLDGNRIFQPYYNFQDSNNTLQVLRASNIPSLNNAQTTQTITLTGGTYYNFTASVTWSRISASQEQAYGGYQMGSDRDDSGVTVGVSVSATGSGNPNTNRDRGTFYNSVSQGTSFTGQPLLAVNDLARGGGRHAGGNPLVTINITVQGTPSANTVLTFYPNADSAPSRQSGSSTFSSQTLSNSVSTSDGITGPVTLLTSQDYFNSGHVGVTLLIGETEATITAFTDTKTVSAFMSGILEFQLDRNALKTANGTNKIEVTHALHGLQSGVDIEISEAGTVGGISASNINGTRTISEIIDDNTYKITAGATASSTEDGGGSPKISGSAATTEWFEQSYSSYRGFPQAVTFHEDRLWFAGTPSQPLGIWSSRTGLYFDFDIRDGEDNDALDIEANIGVQAQIRHLVSNRDLQVFSSEFEFFIPAFTDQAITPANAKISSQTPYGIGYTKPLPFDGVSIFAQADGKTIRDFIYSDAEGAYVSNPISLLSSHMTTNVYQSAVLKGGLDQSGSYLFLMRSKSDSVDYTNTELLVYYQIRGDRRAGWVRWSTSYGYMQSICVVNNRVFVACNRRSDTTKRFVLEEFTNAVNGEHCASPHMVDDSTAGTYVASKTSAQFDDYTSPKVVMFTSGNVLLNEYTASSGKIDVGDYSVDNSGGYLGFPFTATAQTQSLDAMVEGGPLTGRPRRITKVVADLQDTKSVVINGTAMLPTYVNGNLSEGINAISERKEFFVRGIEKDPKVLITQDKSLPCQIDGIVVEVAF